MGDLVIYGMVFMLPIAPFALYGIISAASKGSAPLAYVIGAVVMLFPALAYSELAAEFPVAGSVYSYTTKGINATAGFFAGWLILLDYAVAPGLLYIASATALHGLVPIMARWRWILIFVAVGTGINLRGIRFTSAANKLFLLAMLAVLAIFIGVGLLALKAGRGNGTLTIASFFDRQQFSWTMIVPAVLLSSTSFLGFDAITTLGEEVKGRDRTVLGRAGLTTLGLIAAMFVLQTWVANDLAPGAQILSPDTAFYDVALYAGGRWLYSLTTIATALSWGVACAIVCQSAIARILFAMGRDRRLPSVFARVHPVTQQPYVASLFVGMISLVFALAFQNRFDEIVLSQNFGALSAFLFVNAAVIGHFWFKKRSGKLLRHLLIPLVGIVAIVILLFFMKLASLKLGTTWLLLGFCYYLFMRRAIVAHDSLPV